MTTNYGLYTDTAWSVSLVFKDATGAAVNIAGSEFLADVISSSGAVVFRFKSVGGGATDGTIDKSSAATGILTFAASTTQHANVPAGLYRFHLKKDLSDDVWTAEGSMLVGDPGASGTYIVLDDISSGITGALVINTGGGGGGGSSAWGSITGTLSNQSDLQTALNGKQASSADLTAIAGIAGTSGILKKTAAGSWALATAGTDYVTPAGLASYAPLASPALTGVPVAPTAAVDTNTTQLATTAYVIGQGYAKLAGPALTGVPTAPTAAADTATTQLATTAFVTGQASASAPLIDGTATVGTSLKFARADHVHPTDTTRAALASPTFTGVPAAPTAAVDTNTTQVATTAYVVGQASAVTPAALGSAAVGSATRFARADHVHAMPTLSQVGTPTADVAFNSFKITGLANPVSAQDAATKAYVDATVTGLDFKMSVRAATTANVATLAGGAPNVLDGVTLAANDRILVKDQTTTAQNGIYVVSTLGTGANGTWTRASDMDTWAEVPAALTLVEQGTVNADKAFVCTADQGGTLGTTAITWVAFGVGGSSAGGSTTQIQYNNAGALAGASGITTDGTNLNLTGGVFTVAAGTLNGTVFDISQTWGGTGTYSGIKYNVTDSGPANAASLLMDLQVGGTSKFKVDKAGVISVAENVTSGGVKFGTSGLYFGHTAGSNSIIVGAPSGSSMLTPNGGFFAGASASIGFAAGNSAWLAVQDTILTRRGAANLRLGAADVGAINATVTITIAAPGVVTWNSHSLSTGTPVVFTTTGALPTGIVSGTTYYAVVVDANNFQLATTLANAIAATPTVITTTGTQSGVHTGTRYNIAQRLNVQSITGVTDKSSADTIISGGQGTGTGSGGDIIFQVAPAGTTGTAQNALATALRIYSTKTVAVGAAYTVATLPTAGTQGRRAWVTDATAPTFLGTLTGGGAVVCPVFDNGTAWVAG